MDIVVIPAYEPDKKLPTLVHKLVDTGFKVVVVDDGSGENYSKIFAEIKDLADIVTLENNCGKGAALKAGFKHIKTNYPKCKHFITCDADGQHKPEDVVRVNNLLHKGNKFVLTVRKRTGKIPFRSKFGNDLSKIVYTLLTNRYLSDNQSGLRGFNVCHLDWLIEVEKNNYDYEMNVLYYAAKKGLKITTLEIDAIYIENNASSHFSPVKDTIRIYKSLFYLARGTIISFLLAELIILIFNFIFNNYYIEFTVATAGALSLLSSILLNQYIFFKHIKLNEHLTTVVYSIISYFVYTLMCSNIALMIPNIPLFLNFNMVYIICMPLKYFFHQLIFVSSISRVE